MKKLFILGAFLAGLLTLSAQNKTTSDHKTSVVKADANWNKSDADTSPANNTQTVADGIAYSTTSEGIFIVMPKAVGVVKLFSLTGEAVWSGNLVQGRFFIPTRQGIYFLRVNNKSYKVICK